MAENLEHLTNVWEISFKVSISPTHFLLLVSYRDHQYSGSPSLKRKAPSIRVRPMFIQDCESTVLFIVLVALASNQNSKFFHSVPITLINKKESALYPAIPQTFSAPFMFVSFILVEQIIVESNLTPLNNYILSRWQLYLK